MAASPWRVLIVEDHEPYYSLALAAVIDADPRLSVVGRAANGVEAVRLAEVLRPDAVTMDLDMPVLDGVGATRAILDRDSAVSVVVVSGARDPLRVAAAIEAGAVASLNKLDAFGSLPSLLRSVLTSSGALATACG